MGIRVRVFEVEHFGNKAVKAFCGSIELFRARMFGNYKHSGWDGKFRYHCYEWRGREYFIQDNGGEAPHD